MKTIDGLIDGFDLFKRQFHDIRGLTLVELLVVIAIIGVLTSAIGSFMTGNIAVFYSTDNQILAQQEANEAMDKLVSSIMEQQALILLEPEGGSSNTARAVFNNNYKSFVVQFDEINNTLTITDNSSGSSETTVLSKSCTGFRIIPQYSRGDSGICVGVEISLAIKKGKAEIMLNNAVALRNR